MPGLISIVTRVLTGTGSTIKSISICWSVVIDERLEPAPASFAVNVEGVAELPGSRIIGLVSGVENTILIFVRSTVGDPGQVRWRI